MHFNSFIVWFLDIRRRNKTIQASPLHLRRVESFQHSARGAALFRVATVGWIGKLNSPKASKSFGTSAGNDFPCLPLPPSSACALSRVFLLRSTTTCVGNNLLCFVSPFEETGCNLDSRTFCVQSHAFGITGSYSCWTFAIRKKDGQAISKIPVHQSPRTEMTSSGWAYIWSTYH